LALDVPQALLDRTQRARRRDLTGAQDLRFGHCTQPLRIEDAAALDPIRKLLQITLLLRIRPEMRGVSNTADPRARVQSRENPIPAFIYLDREYLETGDRYLRRIPIRWSGRHCRRQSK